MCYHGTYNVPFDAKILINNCKGERLLVACRTVRDKNTLVVAGIVKHEDIFYKCQLNNDCKPLMKNGTGFYYVENYAWGFQGQPHVIRIRIYIRFFNLYFLIYSRILVQCLIQNMIIIMQGNHFV